MLYQYWDGLLLLKQKHLAGMVKNMKINIIGNFIGQDGYSAHVRQLSNALNTLGEEVSLSCPKQPGWEQNVTDSELVMLQRNPAEAEVNICINTPPSWRYYMAENKRFIGFCVFEGSSVPRYWLDIMQDDLVEQIWIPSEHTKQAIVNTFTSAGIVMDLELKNKLKVLQHGVDQTIFHPTNKETDNTFTFIANKGWTDKSWEDRGGLSYLIKAFSEEFTSKDNVKLICKVNPCYGFNAEILNKNILDLQIENQDKPNIDFMIENIDYKKLNDFYNQGDVFVSTSLAEGFNLPVLEAMAAGVPALVTTFGGQSDFVNEENGWLLTEGEMIPVKNDITYEEVQWKKPDIKEIREKLRYIYENQNETTSKAKKALETASKLTWLHSAKHAKSCLKN